MRYGPDGLNEDQQLRADIAAYLKSQEPTPDGLAEEALKQLDLMRDALEELGNIAGEFCIQSDYADEQIQALFVTIGRLEAHYAKVARDCDPDSWY